jgi:hypothetical protein
MRQNLPRTTTHHAPQQEHAINNTRYAPLFFLLFKLRVMTLTTNCLGTGMPNILDLPPEILDLILSHITGNRYPWTPEIDYNYVQQYWMA